MARNLHYASLINLPKSLLNYRNVKDQKERQSVVVKDTSLAKELSYDLSLVKLSDSRGSVEVNRKAYKYEVQSHKANQIIIVINEQVRKMEYFVDKNMVYIFDAQGDQLGFRFVTDEMKASSAGEGKGDNVVKAVMPGTITKVFKKVGDEVKKGEPILAMESMKMETVVKAAFDGKVVRLLVSEKDFVEAGQVLM